MSMKISMSLCVEVLRPLFFWFHTIGCERILCVWLFNILWMVCGMKCERILLFFLLLLICLPVLSKSLVHSLSYHVLLCTYSHCVYLYLDVKWLSSHWFYLLNSTTSFFSFPFLAFKCLISLHLSPFILHSLLPPSPHSSLSSLL